ncbi:unnamed protein product [Oppiella nova]|uniref:Uncharacterized protein n=1 Tax=Oppiella nova TaxID=334625 RepID=A0A7R9M0B8_9ACAR|nr:unnamed protein product [Oppiella nova]CAG2168448.1 unnamed protein product [Oppiella nova]
MDDKEKIIENKPAKNEPVLKAFVQKVNSLEGSFQKVLAHKVNSTEGGVQKVLQKSQLGRTVSGKSTFSTKSKGGKPLTFKTKFFYSMGHIYNDLTFQFSDSMAGALLLIGQMADAIASPFVGFQSDRMPDIWIFRYGRRKFWHLLGVIMNTVTVPFIYNTPCFPGDCSGSSTIGRFAYYAVLIIIFQAGWAATQVSHVSLIVDLTDDTNERIALNAYRQAATIFANICLYTVTLFVIGFDSSETISQDDLDVFTMVSYIVCVIGLVFSLLFHVFVAEPVVPKEERKPRGFSTASAFSVDTQRALFQPRASIIAPIYTPDSPEDSDDTGSVDESTDVYHVTGKGRPGLMMGPVKRDLERQLSRKSTRSMRQPDTKFYQWLLKFDFWKITIMYTMARMFFNLGQVYSPLYLQYSLQMPKYNGNIGYNTIAIMPFATYVAGLVCSFGAKPFSARYGARWVLIIGVAFGVGSCVWIFIGGNTESYKLWQIYVVSALLGIAGTALLISTLALTSDLIGTNKLKHYSSQPSRSPVISSALIRIY